MGRHEVQIGDIVIDLKGNGDIVLRPQGSEGHVTVHLGLDPEWDGIVVHARQSGKTKRRLLAVSHDAVQELAGVLATVSPVDWRAATKRALGLQSLCEGHLLPGYLIPLEWWSGVPGGEAWLSQMAPRRRGRYRLDEERLAAEGDSIATVETLETKRVSVDQVVSARQAWRGFHVGLDFSHARFVLYEPGLGFRGCEPDFDALRPFAREVQALVSYHREATRVLSLILECIVALEDSLESVRSEAKGG